MPTSKFKYRDVSGYNSTTAYSRKMKNTPQKTSCSLQFITFYLCMSNLNIWTLKLQPYPSFYMGVKLGLSLWGNDIVCGCSTECWENMWTQKN